jgi:hypothetical protein
MGESFKLSEQEHERIYQELEADLLRKTEPALHPQVIITGGQPGSGKSKLLEKSREDFPNGNVVVINGDDLRNFHPSRREIFKLDDKRFAERTDPDSRLWTKRLFDKAIETKRNIIFESTMREAGPISETMQRLRDDGYHITAKVVATHERMSTTGIFARYEEQKSQKGSGRWSELSSHDAGYAGMPKTVEHIENNKLVDRLEVYARSGELLSRNELTNGQWAKEPNAVKVIEAERERKPTDKEIDAFRSDWQQIYHLMDERKAPLREIEQARSVYQELERGLERARELDRQPEKPPSKLGKLFGKRDDRPKKVGDRQNDLEQEQEEKREPDDRER